MDFRPEPLSYYVDRLLNNRYFSMGFYCDGELICATKQKIGGVNAINEIYHIELCDEIDRSLSINDENYLVGTDKNIIPEFKNYLGDRILYDGVVFDKDVREGNLGPFIKQVRKMNVVLIGNKHLRELHFLLYDKFIEIPELDCYTEIDRIEKECLEYGKPGVYLFSSGLTAIPLIARLHGKIPNSFLIDMGGTWDVFCDIGLQRGWRQEMHLDQEARHRCIASNLKDL